ncbi:nuclear transport factor 2 family protein [Aquisediminimonas sediminicola]|uniref:nuclear transport factor 2 family protein n=1 Tax=Alteraquisediminimonas sediminicola TaxID=2676787 RepID=UPI001C8F051D|nr:nuclear transport factor 2 family protein [Aquisediminimonas sediminicola]
MALDEKLCLLLEKQAILEALYRYARGWDRFDRELVLNAFHPDATICHAGFEGTAHALMNMWLDACATRKSMTHLITNALIEVSGNTAISEAHFFAHHRRAAEGGVGEKDWFIKGRYLDRFERRAGDEWKIAHRIGVLDFERLVDPADPELSQLPMSARGSYRPADPLYLLLGSIS